VEQEQQREGEAKAVLLLLPLCCYCHHAATAAAAAAAAVDGAGHVGHTHCTASLSAKSACCHDQPRPLVGLLTPMLLLLQNDPRLPSVSRTYLAGPLCAVNLFSAPRCWHHQLHLCLQPVGHATANRQTLAATESIATETILLLNCGLN